MTPLLQITIHYMTISASGGVPIPSRAGLSSTGVCIQCILHASLAVSRPVLSRHSESTGLAELGWRRKKMVLIFWSGLEHPEVQGISRVRHVSR